MTDTWLCLAIGVPMLFNATIFGILLAYINRRFTSAETGLNARITSVESRIASVEGRIQNLENTFTTRFDLLMGRLTDLEKEIHKH